LTSKNLYGTKNKEVSMSTGDKEQQSKYLVVVERDKCTSCGTCEDTCPELFELDEKSLAHIIGSERNGDKDELQTENKDCSLDAADSCPVICIHIYENGQEIV
jgi:ferredoxin